jgi:glyceraldehyde 3-phosphate dehydrogenase
MFSKVSDAMDKYVIKNQDLTTPNESSAKGLLKLILILEKFKFALIALAKPMVDAFSGSTVGHFTKQVLGMHDSVAGLYENPTAKNGTGYSAIDTRPTAKVGRGPQRSSENRTPLHDVVNALPVTWQIPAMGAVAAVVSGGIMLAVKSGEDVSVKGETVLLGVNEEKFGTCDVTSNASCTTNASSPVIAILDEAIGIEKAILNTVHSYTASQSIVDGPNKKDFREGRAAAQNIIPSSTGAAIAVTKAFTALEGLFDGISIRVPTPAGSIADITFISKRPTTVEEVNQILKNASLTERWSTIFQATEEELVSSDIIGLPYASIADLKMTRVVGGNLVKVLAWYDNEMGYTHTLVEHVAKVGATIR